MSVATVGEQERQEAERILRGPQPTSRTAWSLEIGRRRYTDERRVRNLTRSEDDDQGAAVVCDATVAGNLPMDTEFKTMKLTVRVGEYETTRFIGECESPVSQGGQSSIIAHTAGYWLDKSKVNEKYSIIGMEPERVAFDMLNRAPYDKAFIKVHPSSLPLQRAVDETGLSTYPPFTSLAEPLAEVASSAMYVFRDTSLNGVNATISRAKPPNAGEWNFDLGPDELILNDQMEEEGKYSRVIVFRPDTTEASGGQIVRLTSPMKVPGSKAPDNAWLWIEVSDDSTRALQNALIRARIEVDRMTGLRKRGEWVSRFINPYLTRGSGISISQRDYDDEGYYLREWIGEIVGIDEDYASMTQTFRADLLLVSENRLDAPLPPRARRSFSFRRPRLGADQGGRFYLDDTLPFVTVVDESMLDIDEVMALSYGVDLTADFNTSELLIENEGVG